MAADPHMLLAAASLVPGLGSLAAAMDMALYLYEGDSFNAALAAAALIPGGAMLAIGVGKGARALFNLARSGAKDLGAAVKASRLFRGLAGGARAVKSVVSSVSTRISKWVGSKVEAARTKVKGWLGRAEKEADWGPTYNDVRKAGLKDSHHIGQDAAFKGVPGYRSGEAPATHLVGPANVPGTPHYRATQYQARAPIGGTYADERVVAFGALRVAGKTEAEALAGVGRMDAYFMGHLGLKLDSPIRIPGTRRIP